MTREERVKSLSSHLLIAAARLRRSEITRDEYDSIAKAKIEAFADAEAAAMRERAAGCAEEMQETRNAARLNALDRKQKGEARDHETMAMAAAQIKRAIRALPAAGEVGRG